MIFYTAYQIIIGTDLTYYCQYVLGNVDLVMPLSAAEKLATVAGIALLPKVLPAMEKEISSVQAASWVLRDSFCS